MKKLLALVVIFAMAGMANAGLMYQVNGTNFDAGAVVDVTTPTVMVALYNTAEQAAAYELGAMQLNGGAMWVNGAPVAQNLPGSWSVANLGVIEGYGEMFAIAYDTPAVAPTKQGDLFVFSLEFKQGAKSAFVQLLNQNWEAMGAPIEIRIPEPMTLSLLSLGALVLRRRS